MAPLSGDPVQDSGIYIIVNDLILISGNFNTQCRLPFKQTSSSTGAYHKIHASSPCNGNGNAKACHLATNIYKNGSTAQPFSTTVKKKYQVSSSLGFRKAIIYRTSSSCNGYDNARKLVTLQRKISHSSDANSQTPQYVKPCRFRKPYSVLQVLATADNAQEVVTLQRKDENQNTKSSTCSMASMNVFKSGVPRNINACSKCLQRLPKPLKGLEDPSFNMPKSHRKNHRLIYSRPPPFLRFKRNLNRSEYSRLKK